MNSFLLNPLLINNNRFSIEKFTDTNTNNQLIKGLYITNLTSNPNTNYFNINKTNVKQINNLCETSSSFCNTIIDIDGKGTNQNFKNNNTSFGYIKFEEKGNYIFILNFYQIGDHVTVIFDNKVILNTISSNYMVGGLNTEYRCYVSNIVADFYYPITITSLSTYSYIKLYVYNTKNIDTIINIDRLFYIPSSIDDYNDNFIKSINNNVPIITTSTTNTIVFKELYLYNFIYNDRPFDNNTSKTFSFILLNDNHKDDFLSNYKNNTNALEYKDKLVIGFYDNNNIPSYFDNNGNYYQKLILNNIDFDKYYFDYNFINSNRDILSSGYNTNFNNKSFKITNIYYGEKKSIIPFSPPSPLTGIYIISNLEKKLDVIYRFNNNNIGTVIRYTTENFKLPYKSRILSLVINAKCSQGQSIKTYIKNSKIPYIENNFLHESSREGYAYTIDINLITLLKNYPIDSGTDIRFEFTTLNYDEYVYSSPSNNNNNNVGFIAYFEIVE